MLSLCPFLLQAILQRIQTREPYYNHFKWEEDRLASEKYLKNIQEYKGKPADATGRRPGASSRLATGVLGPDDLDPEYQRDSMERLAAAAAADEDDYREPGMFPSAGTRSGTLAPLRH